MTQKDLADRMAARDWKWSQATVWSVETGKRPLRYSEALDICWILDVEIHSLEGTEADINELFFLGQYYAAIDEAGDALTKTMRRQLELARLLDEANGETTRSDADEAIIYSIMQAQAKVFTNAYKQLHHDVVANVGVESGPRALALVKRWGDDMLKLKEVARGERQEKA
jgi:transcriptional regulator with XRE-family HTH domain